MEVLDHKIKIVFSDIDGTLIGKDKCLSKATIAQLKRIKTDIPVVLITSRMPSAVTHLQEAAGISNFPLVCYNGGLITCQGKVIAETSIPYSIVEALILANNKISQSCHMSLYRSNDWYVPTMDYWAKREIHNTKTTPKVATNLEVLEKWKPLQNGAHKIMCMGSSKAIDAILAYATTHFSEQLNCYRSKDTYLEIASKKVSKKTAVKVVLDTFYSEIPTDAVVAFGDNYNDAEMLSYVGIGVAMENAKPEIKAVSNYITSSSDKDGVALFLEQHT